MQSQLQMLTRNIEIAETELATATARRTESFEDTSVGNAAETMHRAIIQSLLDKKAQLVSLVSRGSESTCLGTLESYAFQPVGNLLMDLALIKLGPARVGKNVVGGSEITHIGDHKAYRGAVNKIGIATMLTEGVMGTEATIDFNPRFPNVKFEFAVVESKGTPFAVPGDSGGGICNVDTGAALGLVQGVSSVETGYYAGQKMALFLPLQSAVDYVYEKWGKHLVLA